MPPTQLSPVVGRLMAGVSRVILVAGVIALIAGGRSLAESADPTPVRSRTIELHYRLADAEPDSKVELWYTRDRGATWQSAGLDADGSPFVFTVPAEGLYGFTLSLRGSTDTPTPPAVREAPQRWVFIDYNPPLAQWDAVEADETFATQRIVHLRWTAYDDHFTSTPVALAYRSSVDDDWKAIDGALANAGHYDWVVPAEVNAQVSLRLTVSDLGGHSVERIYGPVPVERWAKTPIPATQPAHVATTTRPAGDTDTPAFAGGVPMPAELEKRLKAQELHRQGALQLQGGRYAFAAERFREALEVDPDLSVARCDLAGIYYLQQDYGKALELYNAILARDAKYLPALRGAALAHGAMRQYPQTRDTLKQLIAIKADDAQAWFDLGDAMFMMGDSAAARSNWTKATTVDATAEAIIAKARNRLALYGISSDGTASK